MSPSLRASFAAAAARPATRALRWPLVLAGTVIVGLRLVVRSADQDAAHGLASLVLVGASVAAVAWMARRSLPALRRTLPAGAVRPTVVIVGATALIGTYLGGAPVLASLERRYGQLWAATLLLLATALVARRFARTLPALERAAEVADAQRAEVEEEASRAARSRKGPRRQPLLQCRGIDFGYGKLQVLHGVDLEVGEGELVALLGVNGAGKSTMLRAISGLGTPTAGTIRFAGEDVTYLDAESRVRRGITQVPGGRAVFGPLTVIDNLQSYAYSLDRRGAEPAIERALTAFPRLAERRNQAAGTLSGGEQQMLAMAKAMMLEPRLLLIDELSLGLAPIIVSQLLDTVRTINAAGTAVVLVEQSVNIALNLADHAFFMERGAVQFDGPSSELLAREDLLRAVFLDGGVGPMIAAEFPLPVITLGAIIGLTYGLLAVGLVLVHRSSRLVNFAHGEVGAFAAVALGVLVNERGWPYYVALPVCLGLGAVIGIGIEILVIRRLQHAPRLMGVVATLGVGQLLVVSSALLTVNAGNSSGYPSPPGMPTFALGSLQVTQAYSGMLILAPLVVGGIALFLRRSRVGTGLRAAAANPDAARLAGIPAARMSALAWGLAGGLAALTAVLVFPSRGFITGDSFGPSLLLRALAAAVVARMTSLPRAFAAGIGLGIMEQLLLWNTSQAGLVEVVLFGVILVALALQGPLGGRSEEKGSWASVLPSRPLAPAVRQLRVVRWTPRVLGAAALAGGIALPLVLTNARSATLIGIMGFAVIGLSVSLVTGLGGQLTLGQFAIGAVGAVVSFQISSRTGSFPVAFVYAGLAGAAASVLIGLPALRSRGLLLTVSTLSFAVVVPAWLITQSWAFGGGTDPGRPVIGGDPIDTARAYYYVIFAVLVVAILLCVNVRRSGLARLMLAVRDNEDNARAFAISARKVKLQGLGLAGFVAGIGGAAYSHAFANVGAPTFPVSASIDVVVMCVLGGVSTVIGPLLGVVFVIGIPAFIDLDAAGLAATKLGVLLVLLAFPGGLSQAADPLRQRVGRILARRAGLDEDGAVVVADVGDAFGADDVTVAEVATHVAGMHASVSNGSSGVPAEPGPVLLTATGLAKAFGGVHAVEDVSLEVRAGEIVGLIGPNGAGKTTTFELLAGFTKPDGGTVLFDGDDISHWSPERRSGAGLVRSFQDAALFATLTVHDALVVALEAEDPTTFAAAVIGNRRAERRRIAAADVLLERFGLTGYRDRRIQELSTGTRRITELACLVAQRPVLLLLDEPASGVAQREIEALGGVLRGLRDDFALTMVVIEHDIPLIMSISDRVIAMDAGLVIAEGLPEDVRNDPLVATAYLGGDALAVERSGAGAAAPTRAKRARATART